MSLTRPTRWPLATGWATLAIIGILSVSTHAVESPLNMNVQNAVLQKLRDRMAARAPKLTEWKDAGVIGEGVGGKIESRTAASEPSLLKRKEIHDLIAAENEDRAALFHEILLANTLPDSEITRVIAGFAATLRDAAKAEHWFKVEDQWVKKKDL